MKSQRDLNIKIGANEDEQNPMKQNANFQVWEHKKVEKFGCLYVRKYSYPWTFKINYYDFINIITPIADVM